MRLPLLIALSLSACASLARQAIYAGPVTPQAGLCDPAARGTLTLRQNVLVFTPDSGTLTLDGIESNGVLTASLTMPGADHMPYHVALYATRQGKEISGTYTTPRCRYHLDLHLTRD